jgi:hypothetical protein
MIKNIEIDNISKNDHNVGMQKNLKFWHETNCKICNAPFWSLIKREQKTCSAKCSGIYVARNPERIAKIKKTKLEKYGSETYVNSEKAKLTCLSKYGVDNASKSQEVLKKIQDTNQKKFGVDWVFQSEEMIEKTKLHNIKLYGVKHVSQRDDIKDKKKKTCLLNNGVENPFQSSDIRKKIKQTNLDKYGAEHPSKMLHVKETKRKKFIDSFYDKLLNEHKLNVGYIPLFTKEEYINTDRINLYKFECKSCSDIFSDHIDGGHLPRCLKCNPIEYEKTSIAEKEIVDYIKSITNESIVENSKEILPSGLELDIYIPSKKIAIEFNGLYWHSEMAGKSKKYHLQKTTECEANNIHLIHIFEDEWKNKKEIVKQKLRSRFISEKRIGARELVISKISNVEKDKFLDTYHIQGKDISSIRYGAFYNKELVAVITFGKERAALGIKKSNQDTYELVRFATSISIVGIVSKFLKVFISEHCPKKIISYADRRFTYIHKNIYSSIGMKLSHISPPNYWYFKNGYYNKYHRFGFRKQVLKSKLPKFDAILTEWQNMQNNGYNRIWDCGNLKYEMDLI